MLVKVVGKRPVAIAPGTVPMESVDLEFRGDGWTHIESIIVSSDSPEMSDVSTCETDLTA